MDAGKRLVSNGLGPSWFPKFLRRWLTKAASWWFVSASWVRHDDGYKRAVKPRYWCDYRFLEAMNKDAIKLNAGWKRDVAICLSFTLWLLVRLFGWMRYGK